MPNPNIVQAPCSICGVIVRPGQGFIVFPGWGVRCVDCKDKEAVKKKLKVYLDTHDGVPYIQTPDICSQEDLFNIQCAARGVGATPSTSGWHCQVTMARALIASLEARGIELVVLPQLAGILHAIESQSSKDAIQADARLAKFEKECVERGLKLMEYQREGIMWLAPRQAALLADPYGSGKTAQVLMSIPENSPVLIVCPASIKGVWLNEITKWRPDINQFEAYRKEGFAWPEPGQAVVTNYEATPAEIIGEPHPGTILIGDESQRLMNPRAQLTRRFKAIQKLVISKMGKTWLVTATPIKGKPDELYNMLAAAGIEGIFGTIDQYRAMYNAHKVWHQWVWGKASPQVAEKLKTVMLRRRKEDILSQLPKITVQDVPVAVWDSVKKECDKAEAMLKELGVSLETAMKACLKNKSSRIAFEELSRVYALLATAKIPAVMELVEDLEAQDEPVVLFSAHRAPIEAMEGRPGWRVIHGGVDIHERNEIVSEMQDGKLRGVAMTIATGGLGLTLTRSCNAIFIDLDWTPDNNKQAEARVLRIGQGRPVLVKRLVAEHSLDKRILEIHQKKAKLMEETIDRAITPASAPDSLPAGLVTMDSETKEKERVAKTKKAKPGKKTLFAETEEELANKPKKQKVKVEAKQEVASPTAKVEYVNVKINGAIARVPKVIDSITTLNASLGVTSWTSVVRPCGEVITVGSVVNDGDVLSTVTKVQK